MNRISLFSCLILVFNMQSQIHLNCNFFVKDSLLLKKVSLSSVIQDVPVIISIDFTKNVLNIKSKKIMLGSDTSMFLTDHKLKIESTSMNNDRLEIYLSENLNDFDKKLGMFSYSKYMILWDKNYGNGTLFVVTHSNSYQLLAYINSNEVK